MYECMEAIHIQTGTLCNESPQIWQPETIHTSGLMVSVNEESSEPPLGPLLEYFSQDPIKDQLDFQYHLKNKERKDLLPPNFLPFLSSKAVMLTWFLSEH